MDVHLTSEFRLKTRGARWTIHNTPSLLENVKQPENGCLFKIEQSRKNISNRMPFHKSERKSIGPDDSELLVQNHTEQRTVHLQPTVVVDQAKVSEFIHEEIHA